jgi:hypothetical protein
MFDRTLGEDERGAWVTFKAVTTKFLRNFKAENYESLVEDLLNACKITGCKMSLKIHFLDSYSTLSQQSCALLVMSMENAFIKK